MLPHVVWCRLLALAAPSLFVVHDRRAARSAPNLAQQHHHYALQLGQLPVHPCKNHPAKMREPQMQTAAEAGCTWPVVWHHRRAAQSASAARSAPILALQLNHLALQLCQQPVLLRSRCLLLSQRPPRVLRPEGIKQSSAQVTSSEDALYALAGDSSSAILMMSEWAADVWVS